MRSNYLSAVMFSLLALPLVACGGDDGGGTVIVPDAKVFMDAPPDNTAPCTAPATIPALRIGMEGMPISANWIVDDQQLGGVIFRIASYLPNDMENAMIIIIPRPEEGFDPIEYPFDPDPNSTALSAFAFMQANINQQTMMAERILWASSGSMTFSQIGSAQGAAITGVISMTNFREVDPDANFADVPGGCTSSLTSLNFYGTQMTGVGFAPTEGEMTPAKALELLKVNALPMMNK